MKILFIVLCFQLMVAVSYGQKHDNNSPKDSTQIIEDDQGFIVKVGQQAPDHFKLKLGNGISSLKQLRGKVILLQFTANWCEVCRGEISQ